MQLYLVYCGHAEHRTLDLGVVLHRGVCVVVSQALVSEPAEPMADLERLLHSTASSSFSALESAVSDSGAASIAPDVTAGARRQLLAASLHGLVALAVSRGSTHDVLRLFDCTLPLVYQPFGDDTVSSRVLAWDPPMTVPANLRGMVRSLKQAGLSHVSVAQGLVESWAIAEYAPATASAGAGAGAGVGASVGSLPPDSPSGATTAAAVVRVRVHFVRRLHLSACPRQP